MADSVRSSPRCTFIPPRPPVRLKQPGVMTVEGIDPSLSEAEALAELTRCLPEDDGVPMEDRWHNFAAHLIIDVLAYLWRGLTNYFMASNMFLYYNPQQRRNVDFVGPDFFYVRDADLRRPRHFWAVWDEESKYPDLIIEFVSESTEEEDRVVKKRVYEQVFRTPEYFIYDPRTCSVEGWRLQHGVYERIPADVRGWVWSEVLQLWLGNWTGFYMEEAGTWPRFYDQTGNVVPTSAEAERQRAEVERQRAETAEAELARLRALLAQQGTPPRPANGPTQP